MTMKPTTALSAGLASTVLAEGSWASSAYAFGVTPSAFAGRREAKHQVVIPLQAACRQLHRAGWADDGHVLGGEPFFRERVPAGGAVLDMMSSWVSHLPPEVGYSRVDGHGMNLEELGRNPRLRAKRVWDLNADPRLPFDDEVYDAVLCTVSVQYLQQPEKVFADVRRVLKPGGVAIFSFSNRMFSDKAIKGWINRTAKGRSRLVSEYFKAAGGFSAPEVVKRKASESAGFFEGLAEMLGMVGRGNPFYAVVATKEA